MVKKLNKVNLIELNEKYQKVLYWFFSFPRRRFSLTNISKELKISKTNANIIINKLNKENLIKIEKIGKSWVIYLNNDYSYLYKTKIGYNLMMIQKMLYDSEIIEEIHKIEPNYLSLILFGSYRKGDDNEESDIDIAVESGSGKELKVYELGVIPSFGFRKNVPVNLHIFSRNKIDINLFSNIANGIILEGFLEVRP